MGQSDSRELHIVALGVMGCQPHREEREDPSKLREEMGMRLPISLCVGKCL